MLRVLGLAQASKLFRKNAALKEFTKFSNNGNEVAFSTIGDASTSEGHFFEAFNAAGVLQIPLAISVWDDGWGISVPNEKQTTKSNISEILSGFEKTAESNGYYIYRAQAWDYPGLIATYREGISKCRSEHVPVLFHIMGCTQPQGHSTSGSHERYKTPQQLEAEKSKDGIVHLRQWILDHQIASNEQLDMIEKEAEATAREARRKAWMAFQQPLNQMRDEFIRLTDVTTCNCAKTSKIENIKTDLSRIGEPIRKDIISSARKILRLICNDCSNPSNSLKTNVSSWLEKEMLRGHDDYSSHLYSETELSAMKVTPVAPTYDASSNSIPGREILRENFDKIFEQNPLVLAFGEDVGKIGGVNQTYEGLQEKYGELRIDDTGIREATIMGQAIGLALRGLRPIAEIQYFDYLLYALQAISDDLATTRYRTRGGQKAPVIISTRGHRLEGIWHAGSP